MDTLSFLAPLAIGLAAYIGHVVVRGTKISELRQAWINDQRADLATFISRAAEVLDTHAPSARREAMRLLNEAGARLKLRENPTPQGWDRIRKELDNIEIGLKKRTLTPCELNRSEQRIIREAKRLLKREWNRVRDGEPSYAEAIHRFKRWLILLVCTTIGLYIPIGLGHKEGSLRFYWDLLPSGLFHEP